MDLQNIKDKVDILKVYNELTTEIDLKGSGMKVKVNCFYPDHQNEDNSCVLDRNEGVFYCLECKRVGGVVDMIQAICGVEEEAAMRWISENYNLK